MKIMLILIIISFTGCASLDQKREQPPEYMDTVAPFIESRKFQEAHVSLKHVLDTSPKDIGALRFYQNIALSHTKYQKHYEKIYRECEDKQLTAYLRAREQALKENTVHYLKSVKLVKPYWKYIDIATIALKNDNYELCESYLEKAKEQSNYGETYLLYAFLYLRKSSWTKALYCARKARSLSPYLIKPYFFEAANNLIFGEYQSAISWFRKIQILFPYYHFNADERNGFQSALWRELVFLKRQKLFRFGLKTADLAIRLFPNKSIFLTFRSDFLWHQGRTKEAIKTLKRALEINPYNLYAVRIYRKILFSLGEYRKAYALWKKLVPDEFLYHSKNLVRKRYIELREAMNQVDRYNKQSLYRLAKAVSYVGWEKEALYIYALLPEKKNEYEILKRHVKFIEGIKNLFYAYYETGTVTIVRLIDYINRLAQKYKIPFRTVPRKEFKSYFLVVRELDPFEPKPGSLAFYLKKYNKTLDLGNNYGHNECRMMNIISRRSYKRNIWGKKRYYSTIIGDETHIASFIGYHSGSTTIAGRAFLSAKGFYVALDTIRPSLTTLKYLLYKLNNTKVQKAKKQGAVYLHSFAVDMLRKSLLRLNLEKFTSSKEKLALLYKEILLRRVDTVHNHELGHAVDFPRFLPFYKKIGNVLRMVLKNSASPEKILKRFERIAEAFGLAHTKYPYFYLWQLQNRLNVKFEGVFELIYWAWYGRLPKQDPYHQAAIDIYQKILKNSKKIYIHELRKTFKNDKPITRALLHKVCKEIFQGS